MVRAETALLKRVLISNRGEIAIRIAKAAAGLGMQSVGVYAPVDTNALHTRFTDATVEIAGDGVAAVSSYLDADALIAAALAQGCDCVHPGYGFLAENAAFAERCEAAGLRFVGPPAAALALFGDKVRAREFAQSLGIPVVPGSHEPVGTPEQAQSLASEIGYPVLLKAAAGGGGRGMRQVSAPDEMAEAFARCRNEAEAAFGDGSLFLEKLILSPRHIEVQVLADASGNVIHLHERDCSVQLRHQKVVEIAPAPNLDDGLRAQITSDATNLVRAAGYVNAGTVEFLVSPEDGRYYFIECNPRIQVEHTVTEQVTGIDLVEAQFLIASGASLAEIGLGEQAAVGAPRGYAVQARVVATGPGTLQAYKEPSGPGVRVDASGYLGYTPSLQFDPLLAKVIGSSNSSATFASAVDRTLRALEEFHVSGVPTNIPQLRAILSHPRFRSGEARTTFLAEEHELSAAPAMNGRGPLGLLEEQARTLNGPGRATAASRTQAPSLAVAAGMRGAECPMSGTVVSVNVQAGQRVTAGETLLVVSAMKMETAVTAPCSGEVSEALALRVGDAVEARQVVVVIAPSGEEDGPAAPGREQESWAPLLRRVQTLQELAAQRLAPGSADLGVVRQRDRGKLTCRERIDLLLDDGTFREMGSVAGFATQDEHGEILDFTPANHVGGWGKVGGRTTVVCADDFTSRGGHADGAIGQKSRWLDRMSLELRAPSVRLLDGSSGGGSIASMVPAQKTTGESAAEESTGAIRSGRPRVVGSGGSSLGGHLGGDLFTEQLATVPVVNVLLGSVVGIGAAKAVLGHFGVMVRDIAQLFVAGPPVVSHAMGYDITKEELGGWHIHCRNGSVDNLAETEEEALAMTRRFLSYLPSSAYEAPPVLPPDPADPADRRDEELFGLIPRQRTMAFNVRRAIELMVDRGSFFEIGPLWGTDQVTGFARFNGYPVGIVASDSQHINGGAMTADGCDKLTRHLDLCDTFHLPVLNLVDNPGFAVGLEHELTGTIRKGGTWMVALSQVRVPIFTVLMRRSFGVAGGVWATPHERPSVRVTWPAADTGGIPPEGGIEAAYKRQLAESDDPAALRAEIMARIESVRGPMGPASRFQIEELIDPRDTRGYICEWMATARQVATHPSGLTPRALGFRP